MILVWIAISMLAGPIVIALVAVTTLLLKFRKRYSELLAGFWVICTLSDNRAESFHYFEQAKYVYLSLLALFLIFDNKSFKPFFPFFLRFLPFIIVAFYCLSNTPAHIFNSAIAKTISYFLLLLVVPNYVVKAYREDSTDFFRLLFYVAIFILLLGLIVKPFFPLFVTLEERYRGMLGNPNGLGLYCLVVFILFGLLNKSMPYLISRQEKLLFYALILTSVFLCGSRNAIIAILIYLFFSSLGRISVGLGLILLVIIAVGYEYINLNVVDFVKSLSLEKYLRADTLSNAAGRFIAWKLAWEYISKNIFIGHGFEYTDYLFYINQKSLNAVGHQGNAHNSYLTFWLDTGITGLIFYFAAFLGAFIKAARRNKAVIAGLYAILFAAVFESYLTASLNPYTMVVFIILTIFTSDEILQVKTKDIIPLH